MQSNVLKRIILLQNSKIIKPLIIGARALMGGTNKITSFAIYTSPTYKQATTFRKILKQYKSFQDVFKIIIHTIVLLIFNKGLNH